jgi:F-type H+-transporting ATPase subunit c
MKKVLLAFAAFLAVSPAMAETSLFQFNEYSKAPFYFIAVAIAAFAGTKAQSAAASVALEGMARNPSAADKLFVPMILGLALMESLVIFTLISVYLIQ